jgi:catechol 2,3-dioxygenase-like lactoylglutathione lyase family enzyme
MLGNCDVRPEVAVKDLATAKKFYEGTLGLKLLSENEEEMMFQSGGCHLSVYRSQFAGTNKATNLTWECDDVEGMVAELADKGIAFEHYDMPGVTRQGDVHVMGDLHAAWFKDTDGNILCIANMPSA